MAPEEGGGAAVAAGVAAGVAAVAVGVEVLFAAGAGEEGCAGVGA